MHGITGMIIIGITVLLQCRYAKSELQIAILMQGSDFINVSIVPLFDVNQYDLGDVYISPCREGTYNENRDSYCKPCDACVPNQYETRECIAIHNRVCVNCTACSDRDQEICTCGQHSAECVTGNRVCLPLPATAINITFELTVSSQLSVLKERFLQEGLRTGFVLYLSTFLQHPSDQIFLLYLNKLPSGTVYTGTFAVNNVYSLYTKTQVTYITQDVIQTGLTSTFGIQSNTFNTLPRVSRRLLQINIDLWAGHVEAQCISQGVCGEFFIMLYPDDPCKSKCEAIPCPVGYSGVYGLCEICPNATYKDSIGNETCTPCPPTHTSDQGSTNLSQCVLPQVQIVTTTALVHDVITTVTVKEETLPQPSTSILTNASATVSTLPAITDTVIMINPSYPTTIGIRLSTPLSTEDVPETTSVRASATKTTVKTTTGPLATTTSATELPPVTTTAAPVPQVPSQPYYYFYPSQSGSNQSFFWNYGQSGVSQSITINEGKGDWAMLGIVALIMSCGFCVLACVGARLFLVPVRQNNYYYYYTKIKDNREIPIPIRRPSPLSPLPTPWAPTPIPAAPAEVTPIPLPSYRQPVEPEVVPSTPWAPTPPPDSRTPSTPWAPIPSRPPLPPAVLPAAIPRLPTPHRPPDDIVFRIPVQHLGADRHLHNS